LRVAGCGKNKAKQRKIMEKVKKIRRKYILNKPFQFGYVAILIFLQLCVAVLVGLVISYFYLFVFNHGNLTIQHNYDLFLQWAIVLGTLSVVLIIWAIAYTHRIIGPVYRTRMLLRAAASGNIPSGKIKFRKNDKFKDLEDDLAACFELMQKYRDASGK
jgi:ABC-type multidrug transport system fused ATPase/permease subunit